jgi:hypothetical protein
MMDIKDISEKVLRFKMNANTKISHYLYSMTLQKWQISIIGLVQNVKFVNVFYYMTYHPS